MEQGEVKRRDDGKEERLSARAVKEGEGGKVKRFSVQAVSGVQAEKKVAITFARPKPPVPTPHEAPYPHKGQRWNTGRCDE
ncbi:hypothetical protein N7492_006792 [Penicillium capsulatum]|uniref:Uncharacterized protein n=1 Tax=Penicillium capsulatum TaxID=69766 RepID=A0A9W9I240_9EURO|nr:hypothetical protein N7492_006792 [Penicillium capsulatum]